MPEHKSDELSATGTHRVWSGPAVRAGGAAELERRPLRNLGREQGSSQAGSQGTNPRHAAITRSLHSWTSYKSWTDKVRDSWDKDTGEK